MNKFTIDELRADVDNYIREIMCGTFYHFETQADLDETINFLVASLIGIDAYELMSARHSTYKYYVEYAELWIADQDTGHTIWLG